MRTHAKYITVTVFFLTLGQALLAQTENPFLDRAFWRAKQTPTVESVKKLINEGHSLTDLDYRGYDALSNALLYANNLEITKLLVDNGADVNKKVLRSGRSNAFWAIRKGNLEILKYLVSKGVSLKEKDSYGYSLPLYAASSGVADIKIYQYLLNNGLQLKGAKDENGRNAILLYAGHAKNAKLFDFFVSKGVSLHETDNKGNGVFAYASRAKNNKVLKELVSRGVSYKANPKTGENAFTFATYGHGGNLTVEFFKYLEFLGLDPKATTTTGGTCLRNIAYSEKNIDIYTYFIDKGVNPNQTDDDGNTPLIRASFRNSKEIVAFLLSKSKDVNHVNNDGQTALGNAVRRNTVEVIEYLISNGADVKIKDKKNNDLGTQLVDSYRSSDMKIFREKMVVLKANGYDPKKASVQNGNSLLQVAIRNGNSALVNEIIEMQIPLNSKNEEGYTPLHVAAMTAKDDKLIKKLIDAGANKAMQTEFGESVYDLAMENETLISKKVNLEFLK